MPPKTKPRGLKASKGAVPFVPEAAPVNTPSDRTLPADKDALTLADLFHLRRSALDILLLPDSTAEQQEEARGLLRGILHGCELLTTLLPSEEDDDVDQSESEPDTSKEQNPDLARALGLRYLRARCSIHWLQAFALHELSSTLRPPEPLSTAAVSSAATGGAKKRKVDLSEPTSPEEWLDEALERYATANEEMYQEEPALFLVAFYCDYVRALGERARMHLAKGEGEDVAELVEKMRFNLENQIESIFNQMQSLGHAFATVKGICGFEGKYGEVWPAFLRATSLLVSLVDGAEESGRPQERCQHLAEVIDWFEEGDLREDHDWVDTAGREKVKVEIAILVADASLARFMIRDDEVEQTFRPEAEDVDEEGEGEVIPLPDNEEVRVAKTLGEEGESLPLPSARTVLTSIAAQPSIDFITPSPSSTHFLPPNKTLRRRSRSTRRFVLPALLTASLILIRSQLEETLLIYGSLINADDEEGTKKVEEELEKVRKDGGIEEESEE